MKRLKLRILVLILLFAAALCGWFWWSGRRVTEQPAVQLAALEEPTLPVIWAESLDRRIDVMRGFTAETDADVAADTLIILPEDRHLPLSIEGGSLTVTEVRYEIRSADLEDLIERTDGVETEKTDAGLRAVLPIQDLLKKDQEYRLEVTIRTAEKGDVHYYARIAMDETGRAAEMLDLAEQFSERNFDSDAARENTTFLESNASGDNTTLSLVNLKSSFSQLTYGNLHPKREGEADLRLAEYTGQTGVLERNFLISAEDGERGRLLFEVHESFTMRRGPERLYMMDYTRTMNEIFLGCPENFSGGKVMLGVSGEDALQAVESPGKREGAFVAAGDLWLTASAGNRCVRVFSFRSGTESGLRANYTKHGIRILSLSDDGNLMFLVYGYMNRGRREGRMGIALLEYSLSDNAVTERVFIPSNQTFDELARDVRTLSCRGAGGIVYLKLRDAVYALDLQSGENVEVCSGLREGTFAVDAGMDELAWQDEPEEFGSSSIHFMDLGTGEEKELNAAENGLLKPIGFIGRDLAVGIADQGNVWILNGKARELPFTAIEIVDENLVSQTHYEEQGTVLTDSVVTGNRIHLTKAAATGEAEGGRTYAVTGSDTIVSSEKETDPGVLSDGRTDLRERTWYCALPGGFSEKSVQASAPGALKYENGTELNLSEEDASYGNAYYEAYGGGRMLGCFEHAGDAVKAAYEAMGYVRCGGKRIYFRASQAASHTIRNPQASAEKLLSQHQSGEALDLYGADLRAAFYFVSCGRPVLGWSDGGVPLVIYGYDATTVFLYNASDGSTLRQGISEAEAMFANGRNDFCCETAGSAGAGNTAGASSG